jgi:hypothetical protein
MERGGVAKLRGLGDRESPLGGRVYSRRHWQLTKPDSQADSSIVGRKHIRDRLPRVNDLDLDVNVSLAPVDARHLAHHFVANQQLMEKPKTQQLGISK